MKNIKLIIFDADDTTISFSKADKITVEKCTKKCKHKLLFNTVYATLDRIGFYLKNKSIISTNMKCFKFRIYLMGLFLFRNPVEFYKEYVDEYVKHLSVEQEAKYIIKTLKCKGIKVVIASNNILNEKIIQDSLEIPSYYASDGQSKKDIYTEILKEYQIEAEQAVVVGDNLFDDVLYPGKLGIKTIWYNRKYQHKKSIIHLFTKPDAVIGCLIFLDEKLLRL